MRRACHRSPASTPPSTAPSRRSRRSIAIPLRHGRSAASAATASTACPMSTSPPSCRRWRRRSRVGAWWWRISATGPRSARCRRGAAWRRRWASRRWTDCRWARAAAQLDPAVVLHLLTTEGMDAKAIEDLLYRQSGMLGLSGISSDFRDLLESDQPRARFAIEVFVHQVARNLASLAAVDGWAGRHRLHRRRWRERGPDPGSCLPTPAPGWAWSSTPTANAARAARISTPGSRVGVHVIPTDENLMIARHTRALVR